MINDGSQSFAPAVARQRQLFGRLRRLVQKELREILRDRRTIITLVVMPLLIYPLLAVAFQRFLVTSIPVEGDIEYVIGVDSQLSGDILTRQLDAGDAEIARHRERAAGETPPKFSLKHVRAEDARRRVVDSSVHLVALARRDVSADSKEGLHTSLMWQLVYRAGSTASEDALQFVESRLQAFNESHLDRQLQQLGVVAALPAATERYPITFAGAPIFSLAALIPLILVLMTVTGAVYPAIDLTAGERERGTLETLIAAPVPRLGLLLAKYVAVLTVALLTAIVNLAGMTITAHSTGLAATLFGGGMSLAVIVKVLLLLALFAAFFSAILLALTSYARSFKEAQAYIIPLMLLCLVPGVLCLIPSLEFKGWMAVTPLVNIVMLARDLLEGHVDNGLATIAVCSTLFYVMAAIALAAQIFGTDAILYGSAATWSDLVRRPVEPQSNVSLATAVFGLALMFPSYFVLANSLAHSAGLSMDRRLVMGGLITAAVFGGIPIALTMFGRVRWASGLGLRSAGPAPVLAAGLLGLVLWPAAHEIYLLSNWLGLSMLGTQQIAAAERMIDQLRTVPLWIVLVTLGLVPAIFEELCFRGFLFGALRTRLAADRTVIASALLFGLFHEILFPGRLLASTFLGLVLGWVRLRTGSILPGMALHVLHNGLLLSAVYCRDELIARDWGVGEQQHLPVIWHAAAAIGILLATSLLFMTTRKENEFERMPPRSDDSKTQAT